MLCWQESVSFFPISVILYNEKAKIVVVPLGV